MASQPTTTTTTPPPEWARVDEYAVKHLHATSGPGAAPELPSNEILAATLENCRKNGLPDIAVSASQVRIDFLPFFLPPSLFPPSDLTPHPPTFSLHPVLPVSSSPFSSSYPCPILSYPELYPPFPSFHPSIHPHIFIYIDTYHRKLDLTTQRRANSSKSKRGFSALAAS